MDAATVSVGVRVPRSPSMLVRRSGGQVVFVDDVFSAAGIDIVTSAIQAPVMNAIQER